MRIQELKKAKDKTIRFYSYSSGLKYEFLILGKEKCKDSYCHRRCNKTLYKCLHIDTTGGPDTLFLINDYCLFGGTIEVMK